MRYLSIDLETTGLNPDRCDIIEIGAVLDDLSVLKPIDQLPTFHCYVLPYPILTSSLHPLKNGTYKGEPYALSMHPKIFRRIATQEEGFTYLEPSQVAGFFAEWLRKEHGEVTVNAAGKNFAMFDDRFLKNLPAWEEEIKIRHRVIDPGNFWFNPLEDDQMPNTATCLERAGIEPTDSHTALGDAIDVVKLVRVGADRLSLLWKQ